MAQLDKTKPVAAVLTEEQRELAMPGFQSEPQSAG
jgi:hypothetical protein